MLIRTKKKSSIKGNMHKIRKGEEEKKLKKDGMLEVIARFTKIRDRQLFQQDGQEYEK